MGPARTALIAYENIFTNQYEISLDSLIELEVVLQVRAGRFATL